MPDWLPLATAIALAGSLVSAGIWIGSINTKQKDFKETIQEIKNDIREINKNILKIFSRLGPGFIEGESPLGLTKLGQEVSRELDAAMWAEKTAERIKNEVKDKEAYNIQEFCFLYANDDKNYTTEELASILRYAYRKGAPKEKVQSVFGIELRDRLLEMMDMEAP